MAQDNLNLSEMNINGTNFSFKDKVAQSDIQEIAEAIVQNNESIASRINDLNGRSLPTVTASDNGKVLRVVEGVWTLVAPSIIYSGSGTPDNSQGNNGDIYVQV